MRITLYTTFLFMVMAPLASSAQSTSDSLTTYSKRPLEGMEVDFLSSYYFQDGNNAAVSGGIGTEKLNDATATIIVKMPLNDQDVLKIDAGVSAYTSASSGNVDPFGRLAADPFVASSGASSNDVWASGTVSYSHTNLDGDEIMSGSVSFATEYDYASIGLGGSYARLFNERNTEISIRLHAYFDKWRPIYPIELRPFRPGYAGLNDRLFSRETITGNTDYAPNFVPFDKTGRSSYSIGLGASQILSKKLQGSLAFDLVWQNGLLSTPFQRVYFSDVEDSFIEGFQLADDIERLPDHRLKIALGTRLHYYINEYLTLRSFYRYFTDDWGITAHTASAEIPVKAGMHLTFYPSFRYYVQDASDFFQPYEGHLSSSEFYTSDYDLSSYHAYQYGFGVSYTDILMSSHIWKFGLKSIDVKYYHYRRDNGFRSNMFTLGVKFAFD